MLRLSLALAAAYLLGAFPTGLVLGKLSRGIDVREAGSGSSGATNVARVLGWRAGLSVFAIDALKGYAAVWFTERLCGDAGDVTARGAGAGVLAVVGHVWPPLAGFRGGRGVATAAGVLGAVEPLLLVGCGAAFVLVLAVSRMVSLASIAAALSLPLVVVVWSFGAGQPVARPLLAVAVALALLIPVTHRDNLARIRTGREPTLARRRPGGRRLKGAGSGP